MKERSEQRPPTWSDVVIATSFWAVVGSLGGFAIAWMSDAGTIWIVASAALGCLACIAIGWLSWRYTVQPALALRWATEEPTAPCTLQEAIKGALRRQQGFLVFDALIFGVLRGGTVGGLLGAVVAWHSGTAAAVLSVLAFALVGAVLFAILELLVDVASSAYFITIVRKCGLPVGYAIPGALIGAVYGMELWRRWYQVAWSFTGAFAIGVPMALLFAALGWERARAKRRSARPGSAILDAGLNAPRSQ